jgi:hypothetical protein
MTLRSPNNTRPDFIIIGAMKSGTSTLQAQLSAQSGVFMTTPKEPNFFSDDDVFVRGSAWYHGLYKGAAPSDIKGEASTHYTKLPNYPQTVARMSTMLPALKLVYVIRNPLERAVSHYMHEWTQGRMGHDPVAEFKAHDVLTAYSCYGMQLAPYIDAFGPDRIQLTSLEQIKANPDGELGRVARHIGLTQTPCWDRDLRAQNVSTERSRRLPLHGLLVDNPVATTLRRALVPKSLRNRVRQSRAPKARPDLPEYLRQNLAEVFMQDRALLARTFPDHPALDLCYKFASS